MSLLFILTQADLRGLRTFRASLESVRLLTESIREDLETSTENHATIRKTLRDLEGLLKDLPIEESSTKQPEEES